MLNCKIMHKWGNVNGANQAFDRVDYIKGILDITKMLVPSGSPVSAQDM
jgi:hypothetical protein